MSCNFVYKRSTPEHRKGSTCNKPCDNNSTQCVLHQYSKKSKRTQVDDDNDDDDDENNNDATAARALILRNQQTILLNKYAQLSLALCSPTTALTDREQQVLVAVSQSASSRVELQKGLVEYLATECNTAENFHWRLARVFVYGAACTGNDAIVWEAMKRKQ